MDEQISRKRINKLLENLYYEIIEALMSLQKLNREQAAKVWYASKTKEYIERNNLYWISPARAYDELVLEQKNDPRWMIGPF